MVITVKINDNTFWVKTLISSFPYMYQEFAQCLLSKEICQEICQVAVSDVTADVHSMLQSISPNLVFLSHKTLDVIEAR